MYTNTSKFRFMGKYGLFTIPKGILNDLSWESGDLLEFLITNENVINIRRVFTSEGLKKFKENGGKYNKDIYKKISKFGGKTGTCGIKSIPKFLSEKFKLKDNSTIYFLPAKYTFLKNNYSQNELNNTVFASFDPKNLKRYDKFERESKKDLGKEYKKWFINEYNLPFFNKRLELSEKNNNRSKRRIQRVNDTIDKSRISGLKLLIERLEKWKKERASSKHPQKKEIVKDLNKRIKEVILERRKLKENPEKIFKEWTEEEIRQSKEKIKRRYNN